MPYFYIRCLDDYYIKLKNNFLLNYQLQTIYQNIHLKCVVQFAMYSKPRTHTAKLTAIIVTLDT